MPGFDRNRDTPVKLRPFVPLAFFLDQPTTLKMNQTLRRILLVILLGAELWLLTGFLPVSWQQKIYTRLGKLWPSQAYDYSRITHPNLDYELRPFRPRGLAILSALAVTNGGIIYTLLSARKR